MTQQVLRTVADFKDCRHGPCQDQPRVYIIKHQSSYWCQDLLANLCFKKTQMWYSLSPRDAPWTFSITSPYLWHDPNCWEATWPVWKCSLYSQWAICQQDTCICYTDKDDIEVISTNAERISVNSVSKLPSVTFDITPDRSSSHIKVTIDDFNSNSVNWGNAETNEDGELVERWADLNKRLSSMMLSFLLSIAQGRDEDTTQTKSLHQLPLQFHARSLCWTRSLTHNTGQ